MLVQLTSVYDKFYHLCVLHHVIFIGLSGFQLLSTQAFYVEYVTRKHVL